MYSILYSTKHQANSTMIMTANTSAATSHKNKHLLRAARWLRSAFTNSRCPSRVRSAVDAIWLSTVISCCPWSLISTAKSWNISFTSPICRWISAGQTGGQGCVCVCQGLMQQAQLTEKNERAEYSEAAIQDRLAYLSCCQERQDSLPGYACTNAR